MAKIEIRCPICSSWENIQISDDATKNVTKGLITVNITSGMICDHSFIAYVDKNLIVRDYFTADFKIETPDTGSTQRIEDEVVSEGNLIKFDLIKLNIPEILMSYVFKAVFLGEKILLIFEDTFLAKQLVNFFKYTMQNMFYIDMMSTSKEDYMNNKIEYNEYLVFEKRKILHDKNNIIDPKKLEIERRIARKFLDEYDLGPALIIVRNEIQKAFEFSKTLVEYIENLQNKTITSKNLFDCIFEKYNEKIKIGYLTFLLDIVEHYFKVVVPKINGVRSFLGFL
ncbi:MAG: hypothetical protein ACXABO_14865 [Promethearchaeota archaeon]|jgi:hypothetical protein